MIPVIMLKRQLMFDGLGPLVTFTTQALQSNLFGLACPFYCSSPAVGTLIACFLSGVAVGLTLAVYFLWLFAARFGLCPSGIAPSGPVPPERPQPPVDLRLSRLAGYLHAHNLQQSQRRRDH